MQPNYEARLCETEGRVECDHAPQPYKASHPVPSSAGMPQGIAQLAVVGSSDSSYPTIAPAPNLYHSGVVFLISTRDA